MFFRDDESSTDGVDAPQMIAIRRAIRFVNQLHGRPGIIKPDLKGLANLALHLPAAMHQR